MLFQQYRLFLWFLTCVILGVHVLQTAPTCPADTPAMIIKAPWWHFWQNPAPCHQVTWASFMLFTLLMLPLIQAMIACLPDELEMAKRARRLLVYKIYKTDVWHHQVFKLLLFVSFLSLIVLSFGVTARLVIVGVIIQIINQRITESVHKEKLRLFL